MNPSRISAAAIVPNLVFQTVFNTPPIPSGDSGQLSIDTPTFKIEDQGVVTVRSDGPGNAGTLSVRADAMRLTDGGSLTAITTSGAGGNLNLQLEDSLIMRRGGLINTESLGTGNGGNITLKVPILVALENSDIIANAVLGAGGNIQLNTQSILGTAFRDQLTPESDITASSQFGLSGVVEINTLEVDPSSGIVALPDNVADPSQQIVAGCSAVTNSQFIATGRGGLPPRPTEQAGNNATWTDLRDLEPLSDGDLEPPAKTANQPALETETPIIEASSWRQNHQGRLEFIAIETEAIQVIHQPVTCARRHGSLETR